MEQLIKTLPALMQAAGDTEGVAEAAAFAVWKHVAGDGLRQHAVPLRLEKKTLIVAVADLIWQKQMASLASQLVFRLNSLLGQAVVTFIEFRIDTKTVTAAREQQAATEQSGDRELRDRYPIPIELVSAAASIHDPALRRSFLGAAASCIRRREEQAVSSSAFRVSSSIEE
jgi:hypothetical protein